MTAACYYQLRRLRQIRRRVGTEVTTQLVLAFATSRLYYCNSVLAALPQSTIEPLQRVQNTAARLIFNLGRCEHVSPCLMQLHRLPIRHRITYKLCTLMHNVHTGKSPRYLYYAAKSIFHHRVWYRTLSLCYACIRSSGIILIS